MVRIVCHSEYLILQKYIFIIKVLASKTVDKCASYTVKNDILKQKTIKIFARN